MTQTINGTNCSDTINGTNKSDTIYANGGNDTVNGGNGNDFIDAGSGNDRVNAGNGNDEVHGGTGNDTIDAGNGNDFIDGGSGNDTINAGNGDDEVRGGAGNDTIDGGNGDDLIDGDSGDDILKGGNGNDTFTGGTGNDLIRGGNGTDTAIFAGIYASYDITHAPGVVLINGQDGTDQALEVEYLKFDDGIYNVATQDFTPSNPPPLPLVSVVATDGVGTEAVDGADFTYTFNRTGDLSQALTVNYSIMPAPVDGATPGVDLQPVTGTITFAAGSSTAVLQFDAIDDAIVENTELFSVVVGVGAGYDVDYPNASAGGSITDNDAFPPAVVSLTPATVEATEGDSLTFTFTRTGGNLAAPLTINYVVNDGPPAGGATRADGDFSYASGMQQITFAAGQTSVSITVQTNDDGNVETDESFPVLLAGGVDYTVDPVNNGSTAIIHDNDVAPNPLVSVVATDGAGTEAVDGTDFTFTFSRTGDNSGALTVNYSIFPAPIDGATPGADFPAQTGTITFAAGSSTAVLQFDAIDDAIVENTELFSVVVGVGAGYDVDYPNASAGGSITDNDAFPPAVVSLTPATVETTEGGSLAFTFTRTGGNLAAPLTINYVVNDGPPAGGATRADGDFSYASGMQQLTFAAGQTEATITVVTNDDGNVETDESFPVLLAGGVDYTVDPVNNGSTAIIHDNDVAPNPLVSVVATDGAGTEAVDGTDFTFTFSRTGSTAAALTVNYTIQPGTTDGATPGADFPAQTGTITFAVGSATAELSFDAIHDAVVENTEFFSVVVGAGAGYDVDIPNSTATASIADGTIIGTNAADVLTGTVDPDAILGLGGDDGLIGGMGADYLDGGAGYDRTIYTNAGAAVNIQLAAGTATIGAVVDTLRSIEFARGSAFGDVYNATGFGPGSSPNGSSQGNNLNGFEGLGGDDWITGNGTTRIEYTNAGAGVTVNLAAAAPGAPVGATGFAQGDSSVGNDTIFGGVTRVRGSGFDDSITGGTANEIFEGLGGNDTINGGVGGIDIAVFTGPRSNYSIVPVTGVGGSSTVTDNVGSDGVDTLTNIELTEFSNTYALNQRVLNLSTFNGLVAGKQILGTNNDNLGVGDNLTMGANANGRFIDLVGGGTDTLTLATAGAYNLNLANVEVIAGSTGDDSVTLQNAVTGMTVNLAGGSDTLNLANGGNTVTASGTEHIHGGAGFDTVTLSDATPVIVNGIESVIASGADNQVTIEADVGVTDVMASLDLGGGDDTVTLNVFAAGSVADLALTGVEHLTSAGGVETVNLSSDTGLTSVDLGLGFHVLNLAPGDHILSVANVFELNSFGTHDDTIDFDAGSVVNQTFNLGFGNDVLNLTGANTQLSMSISGGSNIGGSMTVNDATAGRDLDLNLLNTQAGALFDLGDGNDTLHLFTDPDGFTSAVSVSNVETVVGSNNSDAITIVGSTNETMVMGGWGADFITAGSGVDNFGFASVADSASGPGRDQVTSFDANADQFVFVDMNESMTNVNGFRGGSIDFIGAGNGPIAIGGEVAFTGGGDQSEARLANIGGGMVLQIDVDGDAQMGANDMEIQLVNHNGVLSDSNFLLV